jgi:nucleoid-associated protein YgaU
MKFVWYGIAGLLSAVIAFFAWAWWNRQPTPPKPPATVSAPAKPGAPEKAPAGKADEKSRPEEKTGPAGSAVPSGAATAKPDAKTEAPVKPQAEPEKTQPVPEKSKAAPEKTPSAAKKPQVAAERAKAAGADHAASQDKDETATSKKSGPDQKKPEMADEAVNSGVKKPESGAKATENTGESSTAVEKAPEMKAPVRTEEKPVAKSDATATEKTMAKIRDKAAGETSKSEPTPTPSARKPDAVKETKAAPSKPAADAAAPVRDTKAGAKAAPPAPEKPAQAPKGQPAEAEKPAKTTPETAIAKTPVTKPADAPASRPSSPDRGDTAMARRTVPVEKDVVERDVKEAPPEPPAVEKEADAGNGSAAAASESASATGVEEKKKTAITTTPPASEATRDKPAVEKTAEKTPAKPAEKPEAATTRAKSTPAKDKAAANGNALARNFVPPSFDLVRVERDGSAVIAGRAMPGSTVSIWANGDTLIGKTLVGKRGDWVIISDVPLPGGNSSLTMKMVLPDGNMTVTSPQIVAISRPQPDPGKVAGAAPASGGEKNASDAKPADSGGAEQPETPDEPLVVVSEQGKASKILQAPKSVTDFGERLVFHTVDYDDSGQIVISGKAGKNTLLRAYLNNEFIGETQADKDGQWSLRAQRHVKPGLYQLRVDQLNKAGKVMSRVEVPFERAAPEAIAKARKNGEVIIQPGDNLWNISRAFYGTGMQYTVIYEANKNKIRDPDRIYPGQIFATPDANPDEHQAEREAYRKYMLKKRRRR